MNSSGMFSEPSMLEIRAKASFKMFRLFEYAC